MYLLSLKECIKECISCRKKNVSHVGMYKGMYLVSYKGMYLLSFLIAKSNIHETFTTNYIKCIFEKCFLFKSGYNRRIYCCDVFLFVFLLIKKTSSRSSRPEVFLGKGGLKICSKFTGEHPCRSVISIKLLSTSGRLLLIVGNINNKSRQFC